MDLAMGPGNGAGMRQAMGTMEFDRSSLGASGLLDAGAAEALLNGSSLSGASLPGSAVSERKRVETVVETLANLRGAGESLAEVAHDARNMVTALGLYCDLLEEPGVLNPGYEHYGHELRLVATSSRRLVEKLLTLDLRMGATVLPLRPIAGGAVQDAQRPGRQTMTERWDLMPAEPVKSLAGELLANRNLLAALAGAAIELTVEAEEGALPVRMTGEDLTRILVNLVKNAAEAMPEGGRIDLKLREISAVGPLSEGQWKLPAGWLRLTVEDDGPGIPKKSLEKIFDSGYSTRTRASERLTGWTAAHRGLGLSITRSIVEAAGGSIHAAARAPAGACFTIELPVQSR